MGLPAESTLITAFRGSPRMRRLRKKKEKEQLFPDASLFSRGELQSIMLIGSTVSFHLFIQCVMNDQVSHYCRLGEGGGDVQPYAKDSLHSVFKLAVILQCLHFLQYSAFVTLSSVVLKGDHSNILFIYSHAL